MQLSKDVTSLNHHHTDYHEHVISTALIKHEKRELGNKLNQRGHIIPFEGAISRERGGNTLR